MSQNPRVGQPSQYGGFSQAAWAEPTTLIQPEDLSDYVHPAEGQMEAQTHRDLCEVAVLVSVAVLTNCHELGALKQ